MTEAPARLQDAMSDRKARPTPFVGAGFSSAATNGAAHASWRGLLLEGIKVCGRVGSPMPPGWASRMKDQLDNADAFTYIAVADEITRRLRAVRDGREFATWLQKTVGGLQPTPQGRQIIEAVCSLNNFIVTTNYDTLIERLKPEWNSYTWTDEEYTSGQIEVNTILHLHGIAGKPESIILNSADYERITASELAEVLNKNLFLSRRFIFVGCGDGLNDPNITPLMTFVKKVMPQGKVEHYLLVTGGQLRQLNERPISPLISPVAYGSKFDDLVPFLEKLADPEKIEELHVSQDPEYWERRAAAKPRTALLDLAGPAWEKLQAAREALRRAMRTMDQVEHRGAVPDGMTGWDYRDQKAVHEQLAASVRDPTARLESYLVQVLPVFRDAERDIGRLTSPKFIRFTTELTPMTDAVSELEDLTWQLLDRVTQARDDLQARTDISDDYRIPGDTLSRAHELMDHANNIASSLKEGLARLRPEHAIESPLPVQPPQGSDLPLAPSEPGGTQKPDLQLVSEAGVEPDNGTPEPNVRLVPLLWEVAAGKPMLADEENVRDYLALPGQHVRGGEVYMFVVRGDSMMGEDGVLEGDYVIVDPEESWDNGDMVVVSVGSDEGRATVKRIWHEGTHIHLESSNPAYEPQDYAVEDAPIVRGKVIGIARWHINKARRRGEPPS
jgi:SOS-response transcriptional repressor LexA